MFRAWFSHLTVLHNRTNMVRVFGNSVTVRNSEGETRTRCVTSCAGSTSYLSVVAQTRRGFLSGDSASQTERMTDAEKEIQLEEAYARVTVALTRARRLCVLLCPLDQKGPIGAATILGCLQYGLGHLHLSNLAMPLWQEAVRLTSPSDASFLRQLETMTPHSLLPPVSILVMRPTRDGRDYTFVRLHLVVVDLYRHWSSNRKGLGIVWYQLRNAAPYIAPLWPPMTPLHVWLFCVVCLVFLCCFCLVVLRIVSLPFSSHRSCGVLHVSQWKGTGLALRLMSCCA